MSLNRGRRCWQKAYCQTGAGRFDRRELRDLMKEKGIKLSVTATADRLEFSLSFVKQFEKEALEVLRAVMYEPHLKREDIELARRQLAVLRQQRRENPQQQLGELVRTEFYGSHPYGREDIPDRKGAGGGYGRRYQSVSAFLYGQRQSGGRNFRRYGQGGSRGLSGSGVRRADG